MMSRLRHICWKHPGNQQQEVPLAWCLYAHSQDVKRSLSTGSDCTQTAPSSKNLTSGKCMQGRGRCPCGPGAAAVCLMGRRLVGFLPSHVSQCFLLFPAAGMRHGLVTPSFHLEAQMCSCRCVRARATVSRFLRFGSVCGGAVHLGSPTCSAPTRFHLQHGLLHQALAKISFWLKISLSKDFHGPRIFLAIPMALFCTKEVRFCFPLCQYQLVFQGNRVAGLFQLRPRVSFSVKGKKALTVTVPSARIGSAVWGAWRRSVRLCSRPEPEKSQVLLPPLGGIITTPHQVQACSRTPSGRPGGRPGPGSLSPGSLVFEVSLVTMPSRDTAAFPRGGTLTTDDTAQSLQHRCHPVCALGSWAGPAPPLGCVSSAERPQWPSTAHVHVCTILPSHSAREMLLRTERPPKRRHAARPHKGLGWTGEPVPPPRSLQIERQWLQGHSKSKAPWRGPRRGRREAR